jgi:hypothetical protein
MPWLWLVVAVGCVALGVFLVLMWRVGASAGSPERARAAFPAQLPRLQEEFFAAAAASGKPRGLRWKACDWEPGVEFARERGTGRLAALVGVTIQFEAVEGGDMEGLPAVGNLRNASAVFFYHRGRWHTTGKAAFNLNPDEVVERFKDQYERLPQSP